MLSNCLTLICLIFIFRRCETSMNFSKKQTVWLRKLILLIQMLIQNYGCHLSRTIRDVSCLRHFVPRPRQTLLGTSNVPYFQQSDFFFLSIAYFDQNRNSSVWTNQSWCIPYFHQRKVATLRKVHTSLHITVLIFCHGTYIGINDT